MPLDLDRWSDLKEKKSVLQFSCLNGRGGDILMIQLT